MEKLRILNSVYSLISFWVKIGTTVICLLVNSGARSLKEAAMEPWSPDFLGPEPWSPKPLWDPE